MHLVDRLPWTRHQLFRRVVRAMSWLAVLGLLLGLQVPAVTARPPRDRGQDRGQGAGAQLVEARDALPRHRRGTVQGEIIGGTVVPQGTYPFATFIRVDFGERRTVCTGSLIAPQFVLTAGHCAEGAQRGTLARPDQFSLVIGQSHAFPQPPAANVFSVAQVFRHPGFAFPINDVAVLKLTHAVPASIAEPIALVAANETRFETPGQRAIAAGWGLTAGGGELSPDLRQISTTTISDAACEDQFSGPKIDDATILCAQVPGQNTCQGDSGGPLFVDQAGGTSATGHTVRAGDDQVHGERNKKRRHKPPPPPPSPPPPVSHALLIGVTSFGGAGCVPGTPTGFAQLSAPSVHDFVTTALQS